MGDPITLPNEGTSHALKRKHQQLLRHWRREKRLCIVCGEREGDELDHLPPKVLFPESLRTDGTELFTYPVCSKCNRASSDEDFLLSVLLSFRLNQDSIMKGQDPKDPDLLALYRQAQGHFQDQQKADHRKRLLQRFIVMDPHTGLPALTVRAVPTNQTLTKIVKSIYWLHTDGDILQKYNPGWWIQPDIDTSKQNFIENHLKMSHNEIHWGDRFISRFIFGHPKDGVGGFISCSLHFYTNMALGKGMSWFLIAVPTRTKLDGRSLYQLFRSQGRAATIPPRNSISDAACRWFRNLFNRGMS
jgi:hypothetical protein